MTRDHRPATKGSTNCWDGTGDDQASKLAWRFSGRQRGQSSARSLAASQWQHSCRYLDSHYKALVIINRIALVNISILNSLLDRLPLDRFCCAEFATRRTDSRTRRSYGLGHAGVCGTRGVGG